LKGQLLASGSLEPEEAAAHLAACDLLVQIYPDGISGRRGTLMAGLALGVPIVSNLGALSEDFWRESDAIALACSPAPAEVLAQVERVIADESLRLNLSKRARELYARRFAIQHTVERLLQ
jgi:glycosyltransferase involved in cell wall biosynthesis